MCRPQKVHLFSCGHYILDKVEDGCTGSRVSPHSTSPNPPLSSDRREPCRELLYELVACGSSGLCVFQGAQIMVVVYRSAVMCYGRQTKQNLNPPPADPIQTPVAAPPPSVGHHQPTRPYPLPPQAPAAFYNPPPANIPPYTQQANAGYGAYPPQVSLPIYNHATHLPNAPYPQPTNQPPYAYYNPAYTNPSHYQTYPPVYPPPTGVPAYGQPPSLAFSTATPGSSSTGPLGAPPLRGARPKILGWIRDKLNR